jgi:hypothetical protein
MTTSKNNTTTTATTTDTNTYKFKGMFGIPADTVEQIVREFAISTAAFAEQFDDYLPRPLWEGKGQVKSLSYSTGVPVNKVHMVLMWANRHCEISVCGQGFFCKKRFIKHLYNFRCFICFSDEGHYGDVNEEVNGWEKVYFPHNWPLGVCIEVRDFGTNKAAFDGSDDYRGWIETFFDLSASEVIQHIVDAYNG